MLFQGYGTRLLSHGMLPAWACKLSRSYPPDYSRIVGWPCQNGGSVGVSTVAESSNSRCAMLFYLPANRHLPDDWIRNRSSGRIDARVCYRASRDACFRHMLRPVDVTEMAWCIYMNYPYAYPETYPPPTHNRGRRLRGVVVFPGGEDERLPSNAAFWTVGGGLILDYFVMPERDLDGRRVFLTCICAVSPWT